MKAVVLACRTIAEELSAAVASTGVDYPIFWVESGLHNYPDRLRRRIQEELNRLANVDTVLLAFGSCGNALLGVSSPTARLVFPRVEDCISLLLGSEDVRRKLSREVGTYYLTKGWMDYETSLWSEYHHCLRKYGPEKTARIMRLMLKHYRRLVLIDTGTYDLAKYRGQTEELAAALGLEHRVVPGSSRLFEKLLLGPWDEEFVLVEPGEAVGLAHLMGDGAGVQLALGHGPASLATGLAGLPVRIDLAQELGELNEEAVLEGVRRKKQEGEGVLEILAELQEGMNLVGRRFQEKEYFLSELVRAADLFTRAVDLLAPSLTRERLPEAGRLVIGTVREDIHDLGKNLVVTIMSCHGFKVYDLGVNVAPERFVEAAKEHRPDFVGISCSLTSAIENLRETVLHIERAGLRRAVKVLVGGGPIDAEVCRYVGADFYCPTAQAAVDLCRQIMGGKVGGPVAGPREAFAAPGRKRV
ncbi:MAG: DUF1638 domain-containing protein [Clostridia bacterium]|nr:DUF1638 domain-containing protein [Clostridia bacterium]MDH7573070.1 DUF1638 domain-containing protein [Clostridia bacterium]